MKIVIVSPYLNHHQVALADELYRYLDRSFVFIATRISDKHHMKGGRDFSNRPYCLCAAESDEQYKKAMTLLVSADVALISGGELEYEIVRSKTNKLTFEVSERWLKRGWMNLFSPTIFKCFMAYWRYFHRKPVYKLCCSAYAATDHYKLGTFRGKCFKWGYFTAVEELQDGESKLDTPDVNEIPRLMWCARFLNWKHPEIAVQLARRLKDACYSFTLDMYGAGEEIGRTKVLAQNLGVSDVVRFHGGLPNDEILEQMCQHDIFLFTSDSNEGWGVVANEAMAHGCALVASDAIGSVPYLIRDDENGCIFRNKEVESLFQKVRYLLDNPGERNRISIKAQEDMRNVWSPAVAARNLLTLISDIQAGKECSIPEGPGSKATPI